MTSFTTSAPPSTPGVASRARSKATHRPTPAIPRSERSSAAVGNGVLAVRPNLRPAPPADLSDEGEQAFVALDAIRKGEQFQPAIHEELASEEALIEVRDFNLHYGPAQALFNLTFAIPKGRVTALIGPSGCGKSTFLRSINRLNDLIAGVRTTGEILLAGEPLYTPDVDVIQLRKRTGMVFQKSNPFPMSIYENVVYPLRIDGERRRKPLDAACERALRGAALWDEVGDRLKGSGLRLSGGQQQRLCIARAIVAEPEVLLMDEPCSALDPVATIRIEELIREISQRFTVVIVTHNMQQAARVSDYTAFMYLGRLIEFGPTERIFQKPALPETEQYVMGRFG